MQGILNLEILKLQDHNLEIKTFSANVFIDASNSTCMLFLCVCVCVCVRARAPSGVGIFATLSTVAHQVLFQTRILEWIAISSSRGPSRPRDQARVSCISCIGRRILYPLIQPVKPIYPDPFPQIRTTDQSWGMEVLKKKTKRTVFKGGKVFAPGAWEKPSRETKKSPRCRGKERRRGPRKVGGNPE